MSFVDDYYIEVFQKAYDFLEQHDWSENPVFWAAKIYPFSKDIEVASIRDPKATHFSIEGAIIRANEWEHSGYNQVAASICHYWKSAHGTVLISQTEKHCNNKEDCLKRIQDVINFIDV